MAPRTWLVTGCSSGLGRQFAQDTLKRGDRVVATARGDITRLADLQAAGAHTYFLDVTAPLEEICQIVETVVSDVGRIDVLINNAGYIEGGIVEEAGETFFRKSFETNFFGALKVTQAILPHFRVNRSGTTVFISSLEGWNGEVCAGPYVATKFAMEGLSECLRAETAHLGIRNVIFELGYFRSNLWHPENVKWYSQPISDYAHLRNGVREATRQLHGNEPGDPAKFVKVMIDVITAEGIGMGHDLPERIPIGPDGVQVVKDKCKRTLAIIDAWENKVVDTNMAPVEGERVLSSVAGEDNYTSTTPKVRQPQY